MDLQDEIKSMISDVAGKLGYIVYESSVLLKGENSQVVVKIDHEKGISLDDCEAFSRDLTERLDSEELLINYKLEVSSPGLKRKLRTGEEFARFTGAPVKVVYDDQGTRKTVKGTLESVSDNLITVSDDGKDVDIALHTIAKANLEY